MKLKEMLQYWLAQILGAIAGAALLYLIASGSSEYSVVESGLGQNGWGPGYLGEYNMTSALIFEIVMTALFLITILGVTVAGPANALAGLAIGLTLVVIHIVGIQVTGVSVNPARSIGPALIVGGQAMAQIWLFIIAPLIGAGLAGILFRIGILENNSA